MVRKGFWRWFLRGLKEVFGSAKGVLSAGICAIVHGKILIELYGSEGPHAYQLLIWIPLFVLALAYDWFQEFHKNE